MYVLVQLLTHALCLTAAHAPSPLPFSLRATLDMVYRYPEPVHVKPTPDGSKGLCELALEKSSEYTVAQDKDEAREERAEERAEGGGEG